MAAAKKVLPVWPTVIGAFESLGRHRQALLDVAFPAVAILAIVGTLVSRLPVAADAVGQFSLAALASALAFGAVSLYLLLGFLVAWHRLVLLPGTVVSANDALRWRRPHSQCLLRLIAIALVCLLAGAVSLATAGSLTNLTIAVLVAYATSGYLAARLVLVIPAAACERRLRFSEAWALSRGNGWRLFAVILLIEIPFAILMSIAGNFAAAFDSWTLALIARLAHATIEYIGIAAGIAALATAYRTLRA